MIALKRTGSQNRVACFLRMERFSTCVLCWCRRLRASRPLLPRGFWCVSVTSLAPLCPFWRLWGLLLFMGTRAGSAPRLAKRRQVKDEPPFCKACQETSWLCSVLAEIFDECTAAHNDLHRNRGFSPWQLLLRKTPTDRTACEDPDLAQCSVELVDDAARQRLRVKEESCKAYIEEELSLRKRRKEIHQARLWRHRAAGEWCWYWRSGKHKGSRMKGGVFLGTARVIQERETTAEGVRMKGAVGITEGTSLVRCAVQQLRSLSESEKRMCSIADTESISFQDFVRRLPHSTFLDLTTQTDAPDDAWEEEITGWDSRCTRDPSSSSSFWPHQSDAISRLGPDLMPPSRPMRTDDTKRRYDKFAAIPIQETAFNVMVRRRRAEVKVSTLNRNVSLSNRKTRNSARLSNILWSRRHHVKGSHCLR